MKGMDIISLNIENQKKRKQYNGMNCILMYILILQMHSFAFWQAYNGKIRVAIGFSTYAN